MTSVAAALRWSARMLLRLLSRKHLLKDVFGGVSGVAVVHGDTPSTLLGALMAKRAGLTVAHLEAGLRSWSYRDPFPEELIRVLVMRVSDVLFAPDEMSIKNLSEMGVRGRIVGTDGNTGIELLEGIDRPTGVGPAVVTCHRVENIHSRRRLEGLVAALGEMVVRHRVRFVMHPPTEIRLRAMGLLDQIPREVEVIGLAPHREFVEMLAAAPFVMTDGGSIQEECAALGTPTLLWRSKTERTDGVGRNVVISNYDQEVVRNFVDNPVRYRFTSSQSQRRPSRVVFRELMSCVD